MTLLIAQLKGIALVAVYTLAVSTAFWFAIKAMLGIRVSRSEEIEGLDVGEHGEVAYIIPSPEVAELEQLAS
jgi:Amt family ammonium transporter